MSPRPSHARYSSPLVLPRCRGRHSHHPDTGLCTDQAENRLGTDRSPHHETIAPSRRDPGSANTAVSCAFSLNSMDCASSVLMLQSAIAFVAVTAVSGESTNMAYFQGAAKVDVACLLVVVTSRIDLRSGRNVHSSRMGKSKLVRYTTIPIADL